MESGALKVFGRAGEWLDTEVLKHEEDGSRGWPLLEPGSGFHRDLTRKEMFSF